MPVTEIAVVDVETTGLFPGGVDRIVEIGIVRMTSDGEIIDEYESLINPERDVGPTHIHGIRAGDVLSAPLFAAVIGDICRRLRGAIIGGHGVVFDLRFLEAEFRRAGHAMPAVKHLCTMQALGGRLSSCCEDYGVKLEHAHSAMADARATAQLIGRWLADRDNETSVEELTAPFGNGDLWPTAVPSGMSLLRREATAMTAGRETFLAQLVDRLPVAGGVRSREGFAIYYHLLDRILEDRRVSGTERREIEQLATEWGLSRSNVRDAHVAYISRLATQALADGVLSSAEATDLQEVARLLGIEQQVLDALLATAPEANAEPSAEPPQGSKLAGKSVCFTGQISGSIGGRPITREAAEILAAEAGLIVVRGVTKKLDVLVLADPDTQSGKAKKARAYGTRLMAVPAFWAAIGVSVD